MAVLFNSVGGRFNFGATIPGGHICIGNSPKSAVYKSSAISDDTLRST